MINDEGWSRQYHQIIHRWYKVHTLFPFSKAHTEHHQIQLCVPNWHWRFSASWYRSIFNFKMANFLDRSTVVVTICNSFSYSLIKKCFHSWMIEVKRWCIAEQILFQIFKLIPKDHNWITRNHHYSLFHWGIHYWNSIGLNKENNIAVLNHFIHQHWR